MERRLILLVITLLAAASGTALAAVYRASGGKWSEYDLLLLTPYVAVFVLGVVLYLIKPIRRAVLRGACAAAGLLLAFTVLVYGDGAWMWSGGSTGGLIFLWAPVWMLLGGTVLLAVLIPFAALWERYRRPPGPLQCSRCGHLLAGLAEPRCPECGEPFPPHWLGRYPPADRQS